MTDLPSGTVTFLFTDMEGSTRLLAQLGRAEYGRVLAEHHRLLRAAFEAHAGSRWTRRVTRSSSSSALPPTP
jgi:class 3 adenylate cyclase